MAGWLAVVVLASKRDNTRREEKTRELCVDLHSRPAVYILLLSLDARSLGPARNDNACDDKDGPREPQRRVTVDVLCHLVAFDRVLDVLCRGLDNEGLQLLEMVRVLYRLAERRS